MEMVQVAALSLLILLLSVVVVVSRWAFAHRADVDAEESEWLESIK